MTAEIKFWVFFGDFTNNKEPTDISLPNTTVLKQFTDNLLGSLLSF